MMHPNAIRRIRRLARPATTAAGWLALAAMLALASPGVRLAAAEDPAGADVADGPSCQVDPSADPVQGLEHVIEHARQQALLQQRPAGSAGADDDEVVMLNNRGFNYGTPPAPDASPVAAESAVR